MSKAWAKGSTRAWRKKRARVLLRDRGLCQIQAPGVCTVRADCVHHTKGRGVTGDDERYMVAACTPCNMKTGNPASHNPRPLRVSKW